MNEHEALAHWHHQLHEALAGCGRVPGSARLIPASKTVPPERLKEYIEAGQRVFGENRIQEAKAKIAVLPSQCEWHFIGGLQRNKVREAVSLFEYIHSVDSLALLQEIDKRAAAVGKIQKILIEINVAGESSKHGCPAGEASGLVVAGNALSHVAVCGLMTVAPFFEELERVRPYFRMLADLRDKLQIDQGVLLPELSMGMTHDWKVAVEEGSTMIRIGTGLFGMRGELNH
jgi:PLP dependent protein